MTAWRWLILSFAVALPAAAGAHKPKPQRELVLQVDSKGVVALWRMTLRGPEADLLRGVHDRNADGRLVGPEVLTAAATLLGKAAGGVQLSWDGGRLVMADLEPRLEPSAHGEPLVALGLTPLRLPPDAKTLPRHRLVVEVARRQGELAVSLQTLGPWRVEAQAGVPLAPDARGWREPRVLEAGQRVEVWVRQVDANEPTSSETEGNR